MKYHSKISRAKIILLSLIIGIIYILPHILFAIEMKGNYRIFFAAEDEETEVYTSRIREVYDGHYYISDPFLYEGKSKPHFRSYLSELILGLFGKVFHLPITSLFILNNFIFPVAVFLLIFYFLFLLTKSVNLSLAGSSFILLVQFPEILRLLINGTNTELLFSRAVNPSISFIFFILCLIFTYKSLRDIKPLGTFFSAAFFGVIFYTDPYYWSHIAIGYSLFFFYLLSKRKLKELRAQTLIILGGLIISVPYWINAARVIKLPFFDELIMRSGLYYSHKPLLLKTPIFAALLLLFFYKNKDFNFYFLGSFLIAGLLGMNQQVISGKDLESWHWYYYTEKQLTIMSGILLAKNFLAGESNFLQRIGRGFNKKIFLISCFILIIMSGLYTQLYYYRNSKEGQKKRQFLYDAFLWLNKNTEPESVVLASGAVSLILPVYTHNNVYIAGYIYESIIPDLEIMERFFVFGRIFGMDKGRMTDYILRHKEAFFGMRLAYRQYKNIEDFFESNRIPEIISENYKNSRQEDILSLLKRFRLDYIFYSPYEREVASADLDKHQFLNKVYDKNNVQIYRTIKDIKDKKGDSSK